MLAFLRLKALQRIFGEGPAAAAGAAILSSIVGRVGGAMANEAERLDTSTLRPGESYTVAVRPPYSREERAAVARRDKLSAAHRAAIRPSRKAAKVARKYAAAQRKVDRTPVDSHRWAARAATANALADRYESLTKPSKKAARLAEALAAATADVEAARARTLGRRKLPTPPSRTATFR